MILPPYSPFLVTFLKQGPVFIQKKSFTWKKNVSLNVGLDCPLLTDVLLLEISKPLDDIRATFA